MLYESLLLVGVAMLLPMPCTNQKQNLSMIVRHSNTVQAALLCNKSTVNIYLL
jgi:hypothetical protein